MSEHDGEDYDAKAYMEKFYLSDPLQDPLIRRVVQAIDLPEGSRGLDAGCGVGLQIPPLAQAVGAGGHITGLDIRPEFLEEAGRNIVTWELEERVSLVQGDIYDLPFRDQEFDWAWSASCACYSMGRPLPLLQGFRRILKPGGLLSVYPMHIDREKLERCAQDAGFTIVSENHTVLNFSK